MSYAEIWNNKLHMILRACKRSRSRRHDLPEEPTVWDDGAAESLAGVG